MRINHINRLVALEMLLKLYTRDDDFSRQPFDVWFDALRHGVTEPEELPNWLQISPKGELHGLQAFYSGLILYFRSGSDKTALI